MFHNPIPVQVARQIGQDYLKDILIVFGCDFSRNTTSLVTWGHSPKDKIMAAGLGDSIRKHLGLNQLPETVHEDFRREGEAAAEVDRLQAVVATAIRRINAELADCVQGPSESLCKIEAHVTELAAAMSKRLTA